MARPVDDSQTQKFLDVLRRLGGSAGNGRLMSELEWSETEYWRLRDKLLEAGRVVRGRGRGGSVVSVHVSLRRPGTRAGNAGAWAGGTAEIGGEERRDKRR